SRPNRSPVKSMAIAIALPLHAFQVQIQHLARILHRFRWRLAAGDDRGEVREIHGEAFGALRDSEGVAVVFVPAVDQRADAGGKIARADRAGFLGLLRLETDAVNVQRRRGRPAAGAWCFWRRAFWGWPPCGAFVATHFSATAGQA